MKFNAAKAAQLARKRGLTVRQLLAEAGVSRNAFYHLARKPELGPKSLIRMARALDVESSELLTIEPSLVEQETERWRKVAAVMNVYPGVDRDNVRHTLVLLDEKPEERLRRALRRGRRTDFQ